MPSIIGNPCLTTEVAQIKCLEPLFERFILVVASLAGFVFLAMLLVGGFRYLFSGGNAKAAEAAKGTMTAAFLGMVLLVSAFIILNIIASFTGLETLKTFRIVTF
ncbi:MAG: hypothetical protein AAB874_01255 [Patescibacteria group bacterium]